MQQSRRLKRKHIRLDLLTETFQQYTASSAGCTYPTLYNSCNEGKWVILENPALSDITHWVVDYHFEANLVLQPSSSWFFWSQKWPYVDEKVELRRTHIATSLSWLRTRGHAVVMTCRSQMSHALEHSLLYCLLLCKWNHHYKKQTSCCGSQLSVSSFSLVNESQTASRQLLSSELRRPRSEANANHLDITTLSDMTLWHFCHYYSSFVIIHF